MWTSRGQHQQHQVEAHREETHSSNSRGLSHDSSLLFKKFKTQEMQELALRGAVHKSFLKQGKTNKLTKNQRRLITDMVEKRKKRNQTDFRVTEK